MPRSLALLLLNPLHLAAERAFKLSHTTPNFDIVLAPGTRQRAVDEKIWE